MAFRFVHTADLHLDSPLKSLAFRDPGLATAVGSATRTVFTAIVDLCLAERVDALLIAGDLYDGHQTSMKTARFLVGQFGRLHAAGVRVFLIRGNHDAESRITNELVFPDSVTLLRNRTDTVELQAGSLPVAIHGISFAEPRAPKSLLPQFAPPVAGAVNIGLMHTSLGGTEGHDTYAPCALADLDGSGFAYWALGHVHVRAQHQGRATVVMPGIPQGRDVGEAGPRSVTLVTVGDDGRVALAEHATGIARFDRLPVDLDGAADWSEVTGRIEDALREARRSMTEPHLVLRPTLRGASPLGWRIRRDRDLLMQQAMAEAESLGTVWIDKLELDLSDGASPVQTTGPIADLARLMDGMADDPAVLAAIEAEMDILIKALPRDAGLRDRFGGDPAAQAALRLTLLREGAAEVRAHLSGAEG